MFVSDGNTPSNRPDLSDKKTAHTARKLEKASSLAGKSAGPSMLGHTYTYTYAYEFDTNNTHCDLLILYCVTY